MKKAAFVLSVILAASLSVSCGNSNEKTDSATVSETVTEAVSANENEPDLSAISVFELASAELQGSGASSDKYVGPYPSEGTHDYQI